MYLPYTASTDENETSLFVSRILGVIKIHILNQIKPNVA